MQIVPAIDLQGGSVVRAVGGGRESYHPVDSKLLEGAEPIDIGRAFAEKFGFGHAYIADLDAIGGADPAWDVYVGLAACGLKLWIDAGLSDNARIERMAEFADDHAEVTNVIFGLESLPDIETMSHGLQLVGAERFIFSLDMKNGRPMTVSDHWNGKLAANIAKVVINAGVRKIALIDVATVGMHGGCGTERLCHMLHHKHPEITFYAGGGVRGARDLESLARHGCAAALVGSALHDGWLKKEDLEAYDLGSGDLE